MALVESTPGALTITVSTDDTDDGIFLFVVDEDFPRVSVTSAGIAVGDGTEEPAVPPADVQDQLDALDARVTALEP